MTIDETLQWLKVHNRELTDRIRRGKYTPKPVRRVEIPKPDGGVRKLGIPTVTDRTIQQAMAQQIIPIFEPLFSDGSFGNRPGRSAKDAILKVKEYAEQGYWRTVNTTTGKRAMSKERLIRSGFYDLAISYKSVHGNYGNRRVPNGTHGGVRGRGLIKWVL